MSNWTAITKKLANLYAISRQDSPRFLTDVLHRLYSLEAAKPQKRHFE